MHTLLVACAAAVLMLSAACGQDDANSFEEALASVIAEEFGRYPEVPEGYAETSSEFTVSEVRPFLARVSDFVDSGFGVTEVDEVQAAVSSMRFDEDRTFEYEVNYQSNKSRLIVFVFVDDIDVVAVALYGVPDLIQQADDLLRERLEG